MTREAALLLTSADVTPEKELELELNAVKEKLQRQDKRRHTSLAIRYSCMIESVCDLALCRSFAIVVCYADQLYTPK